MHLPEPCQGVELWKPTSLDKEFGVFTDHFSRFCALKVMTPYIRGNGFHVEETCMNALLLSYFLPEHLHLGEDRLLILGPGRTTMQSPKTNCFHCLHIIYTLSVSNQDSL